MKSTCLSLFCLAAAIFVTTFSSCSKDEPAPGEPAAPGTTTDTPSQPVKEASKGDTVLTGRFDGYFDRASKNLMHILPATAEPTRYAFITPISYADGSPKLTEPSGPENLALGVGDGLLRTASGKALMEGQEYRFVIRPAASGGIWEIEVSESGR